MSLRRYLFEWYTENGTKTVRHVLRAADAKDALVFFENISGTGALFGYTPGASYRVHAVADDACAECYGTRRLDLNGDGSFNIICGGCDGKGVPK
jgi:hypothetical protein